MINGPFIRASTARFDVDMSNQWAFIIISLNEKHPPVTTTTRVPTGNSIFRRIRRLQPIVIIQWRVGVLRFT